MKDEDDGWWDFAIFQDFLIAITEDGNSFTLKNLETNQKREFFTPEDYFLSSVLPDKEGNLILLCVGRESDEEKAVIFSLNLDTEETTELLEWPHGIFHWNMMENIAFHENHLFFRDYNNNLIRADLRNKTADVLIDCASIGTDIFAYLAGYCDDYIVLEVWFENDEKELQVFDYQGKKLRVKKLKNK